MEKVAHTPTALFQCERELQGSFWMGANFGTEQRSPCSATQSSKSLILAKKFNCFILESDSSFPPGASMLSERMKACKPLIVDGYKIGIITPEVFEKLQEYPKVFICSDADVRLADELSDYESRYKALDTVLRDMKARNMFITLKGWRNECFEVRVDIKEKSLMKMERAATCLFGFRQFGVDINGFVKHPQKGICLWLQRRSLTKQRWPGMWDNMVGGGLAVGYTVLETAHKEAGEEASIPEQYLRDLQPKGSVSIFFESQRGLSPNTEFVYDLQLPLDFTPKNQDGEVSEFHLFPAKEALEIVLSPNFKTTSCPVALDFMIRHEVINKDNEPELENLDKLLHIPLTEYYRKLEECDK